MASKLADIQDIADKTFDYIVIGGGTAGCVVASRLSEDSDVTVAVLEAGPPHLDDPIIRDSAAFLKLILDPKYDYMYTTTPQPRAGDQPVLWACGRGLGGSSLINWLVWTIPPRQDIDGIGKLGNEGWTWERFHSYQKKLQKFYPPPKNELSEFKNLYNPESVGHDGPVPISFSRDSSGAEALWQKSLAKYGVETITTSLDGNVTGTFKTVSNINPETHQRGHAAAAYLVPALDRPNLRVLTNAYVHKIVTDRSDGDVAASGVEFEHGGQPYTVFAKKEVVLSAGAIKSPHILELSGIGDRKILEPLGIEVKVDLPGVGSNVQDHVSMGFIRWKVREDQNIVTSGMLDDPAQAEKLRVALGLPDAIKMTLNGASFIPIQNISDRTDVLVRRQKEKLAQNASTYPPGLKEQHEILLQLLEDPNVPDFEILFLPFMGSFFPNPEPEKPYLNMPAILPRPHSRGTIHATSADPKANPAMDPRYYEEEIDIDIMVDGVKFMRKVAKAEPFNKIVEKEELPGPDVQTDEQICEYIRKHSTSTFHTCGSNSMLPRDKGGVVDHEFKVYGTQNIRVVDLSVLPMLTTVHPMATVFTLAEMACDVVRARP
ncbi:uncharacterized protein PHACADRAFT_260760 [Phanerochaete carnosa HHB-10118-sp]|uniref:Glucose-methanol-choline oxidoreductase N-terminal domain-containing protein n=1 Tax=Phanerochaete carnosa (strain HHB-10118-sp) TaxID=650164 RepID=K5W0L1_PHACS|nr:uncharacterized protein PHACADRAFT_260760 [Phanerochaete carnosa HHB-10118-sp]EKM52404.1 hypothetical protein PHACADRAFT_260760 [Phanerochaete carnosa HHB-10118-sp]